VRGFFVSSALPVHLKALLTPQAYPHRVDSIELIETHVSWVLLTGEFVYKIKRPVHYTFVDLRSAEHRAFCCAEEIRLNRRFAPDLYLQVCEITACNGEARIGGDGTVIEHAVLMHQFRREEELDQLLAASQIEPSGLGGFGRDLADIHSQLPVATSLDSWGRADTVQRKVLENFEQCAQAGAIFGHRPALLEPLRGMVTASLDAAAPWMGARRQSGRVRECHGDLHCRNVVRQGDRLVPFDCIEFDPALRWIDVADEVAFLLADLDARGRPMHANAFLQGYLTRSGDFQACRGLTLYKFHRALVRAKVAALEASDASHASDIGAFELARSEHRAYVLCAMRALAPPKPLLILMCGLSGSGKSWLASRLAPHLNAVQVRSDVERKRLGGLTEHARSGSSIEGNLYSPRMTTGVYEHLARCAADVLEGGYTAIIDAAFLRREQRARFLELASRLGIDVCALRCFAPLEVLEARVRERAGGGTDASEADLAVLRWQQAHYDPLGPEEGCAVVEVDTAQDVPIGEVLRRLAEQGSSTSARVGFRA